MQPALDDSGKPPRKAFAMKPLRLRLEEARKHLGIPWDVLERDYLISWILAGISRIDALRETLVFKGGTALKKCYFGDYRFSEDLDFSSLGNAPTGAEMEQAMHDAGAMAARLLDEYAPVEIICERYTENDPHPGGQEAFIIRARFLWQRMPQTRLMIEVTMDEKILRFPEECTIIHEYGEPLDACLRVYALEEIVAEKLRAILQHVEKLNTRGWSRSRARDYYDLWRVLDAFGDRMNLSGFESFLREKCAIRGVTFTGADDFFEEKMLSYIEKTWDQWLGPLVPRLPSFDTVINALRPKIAKLVSGNHSLQRRALPEV
jgi:predicted nucleotidyltransferase component of viral defense system